MPIPAAEPAPTAPDTVVYIDDNIGDLTLVGVVLEEHCARCEYVPISNPTTAIDVLRDRATRGLPIPSLVLIDVKMFKLDGFELAALLRAEPALHGVRIALISSSFSPGDRARADALQVPLYKKPSTYDEAVHCIVGLVLPSPGRRIPCTDA